MSKKDRAEFMLVTSRETRRWIIPKGWPKRGKSPYRSAAREAFEEAGVIGGRQAASRLILLREKREVGRVRSARLSARGEASAEGMAGKAGAPGEMALGAERGRTG